MDQEFQSCDKKPIDQSEKFPSLIKKLVGQSELTLNDKVHNIYLQVGNKFLETLGYKEKAYIAGSTAENTKLTTFKDRGDVDILFVTGRFEVSQEEFQEAGFPGYVWIRATDFTKNLGLFELVDDEFISANTLREVKPGLFSVLKSLYALQTAAVFGTPDKHDETVITTLSKVGLSTNYYLDLTPPKLEGHTGVSKSHFQKPEDSNKLENFKPNEHDVQMIRKLAKGLRILLQPGGTGTDKSRLSFYAEALDDAIKQIKHWGEFLTSYPPSKEEQKKSSSTDDSNKPPSISTTCVAKNHADYVTAVSIKGGVDYMKSWEKRVECQKWPPDEVKKEVRLSDVFLVARKSPQNPNIQKDFCLSFNQAEGILVRSFSSDQRRVYLIMKAYLKGTFTNTFNMFKEEERDMKIKTFHVKTLLFWLFEIEKEDLSENIPYILKKVLKFFREKMIERYLSHYFIPDANLLCEFKEEDYRIAIKCIDTVLKDPVERLEDFFKLTVDDGERIKIDLTPEEIACLATLSDDNGKSAAIDSIKTMIVEGHRGLREMTRDDNGKTNIKEAIMQAFRKYLELQKVPPSLRQFGEEPMEQFLSCSDEEENDICFKLQKKADALLIPSRYLGKMQNLFEHVWWGTA